MSKTKSAAQLLQEEENRKNKERLARQKDQIKVTVFFETNKKEGAVCLRFTGEGSSPALIKEYRGNDGPNPEDNVVVPRNGLIIVSEEFAIRVNEDYPGEFEEVNMPKKKEKAIKPKKGK